MVVVSLSRRSAAAPRTPLRAGTGLIGLAERVELAGGALQHGPNGAATSSCGRCCRGRVIRVLLVDDDALVRSGLRMMLAGAAEVEVVGEADDGARRARRRRQAPAGRRADGHPDAAAGRDRGHAPAARAAVAARGDRADDVRRRRARAAGVARRCGGVPVEGHAAAEIVRAIEHVHAGEGTLSPTVTRRLIALVADDGGPARDARAKLESLSAREREVALASAGAARTPRSRPSCT